MDSKRRTVILIHGGAGTINKASLTAEKEREIRESLTRIITAGKRILDNGGSALDAVTEAVRLLEEDEIYNAGRGSVFTDKETNEMDASIMDGKTLKAGALAGVQHIRNPIIAARTIMEKSKVVMLIGSHAEDFAKSQNLEMVEPSFFFTQHRYNQLLLAREKLGAVILDHDGASKISEIEKEKEKNKELNNNYPIDNNHKYGTVGAVALDVNGNLAAATSTGGMTNKKSGRVGDSPIIGAGCYANNNTVAVSTTGTGESFIRGVISYDLSAMYEYSGKSLDECANHIIHTKLPIVDGDGGLIAIDRNGNFTMPFNAEGMYRAYATSDSNDPTILIYQH